MKLKVTDVDNLIREWDYDRNAELGLDPQKLSVNSHKKAGWICDANQKWDAVVANRYRLDRGCPYCTHQKVIVGENDLETLYPDIAKEWHPTKNDRFPSEVFPGSNYKAWWICSLGHEYNSVVKSRKNGTGCPYCAGKKVLAGFNDLESISPELAEEWDYEKNYPLKPSDVTFSSGKRVWWKCKCCGNNWESKIDNRNNGRGCSLCSSNMRTSFPEQAVFYYIKELFPDAVNGYREIFDSSMELDIYIPSIKLGIEYDGAVFHASDDNRLRDARKYSICKDNGIKLVRICEMKRFVPIINCDRKIDIPNASDKHLNYAINNFISNNEVHNGLYHIL